MKRYEVGFALAMVVAGGATAGGQSPTFTAQEQELARRVRLAEAQNMLREVERYNNLQARSAVPGQRGGGASVQVPVLTRQNIGAWWTNTALVTRLGITDDQKARIERAFENHRQSLTASTELLEKEEAQLGRLLEADPLDRNAVHSQIDRVVQARSEMERTNAAMTLEMREQLTREQWTQLQASQPNIGGLRIITRTPFGDQLQPGAPPSPQAPGQRGGRRGGPAPVQQPQQQ
jgi:hypothetical protein